MTEGYRKERLDRGIKARADDIFALSSYREISYLLLPRALPVMALLVLPLLLETYWVKVIVMCTMFGLLALSWDFIHSAGMISLGHALFFGLGSYMAGALNHYFGVSPWFTIPLATLGGGILSTLLLVPVLRLRGIYFGMVTFALGLMFMRIIEATHILGGTEGLHGLSPFPNVWVEVYLAIATLLACLFGLRRLSDSDYGLVLKGISENDRAVMSGGINIYWYKTQALFVGSAVAAFVGAFMAHYTQIVGMAAFALDYSILPITCVIVGGTGTLAGPVLGAFILVPFGEAMRTFGVLRLVFYCLIMVVFIVALPEGVFHYLQRRYHQFERLVEVER